MTSQATENGTQRRSMSSREVLSQTDRAVNAMSQLHHRSRSVKTSTELAHDIRVSEREKMASRASSTRPRERSPQRPEKELAETVRVGNTESSSTRGAMHQQPKTDFNHEVTLLPTALSSLERRVNLSPLSFQLQSSKKPPPLERMTLDVQHAVIMDDLLHVLMGSEGQYIRFHERYSPSIEADRLSGPEFRLARGLDPSLRDLTKGLLKLATYHSSVEAFVEIQSKVEYGVVNHALCAAMRHIMKEYLALMSDMEYKMLTSTSFTLNMFHIETMDMARKLAELSHIVEQISRKEEPAPEDADDLGTDFDKIMETLKANDGNLNALSNLGISKTTSTIAKGGDVIKLLTDRLYSVSGDPAARELLTYLVKEASRPYMRMLNMWLHRGIIADPFNEFLIKEQKSIRRERLDEDYTDEYWDKRYTLRKDDLPPQIADARTCDKILLAGKFLNVVRECGGVDVSNDIKDVPETIDDPRLLSNVNAAYAHANGYLLSLLINSHKLSERLTSLKHYFFLDQADFFINFMDLASHELRKPAKNVSTSKLQSLLDLALRQPGSITATDPFKEDISVQLNEVGLTEWLMRIVSVSGLDPGDIASMQLSAATPATDKSSERDEKKAFTGIQALQFDFKIPFPLSLVISRKTILRYQLLFRHLVALKHIEQLLGVAWLEQVKSAGWVQRSKNRNLQRWKLKAWNLRAKMLVFIEQVLYFSTTEVVEPNWCSLMAGISDVNTVDALMQNHVDFLDTCLKECMLTNSKLLRVMAKLMAACKLFATYTVQLSKTLPTIDCEVADADSAAMDKISKLESILLQYEQNFDHHLKILMDALNYYAATETVVLLSLCARIEVCMIAETQNDP
ncbi:Spc98 family-domain-containing protein [Lipomyces tetrasporus]|uniref:Spindle pole body component n=1 Tax=Lipomyces tetrasporus TaxID=54092 RepID=A0AAD7QQI0_9ASCO|nr:Spc98 family-domain-containing protein [Lipomyces tetrasporus]KAJ8099500.1 Spc98 family-domain-containing protein [Lipomyces tetrasporus]